MSATIVYEQPLNERIRTFLRLEYLFGQVQNFIQENAEWEARQALSGMIDIADLLNRTDIKAELIKELESHQNTLIGLQQNPGVDPSLLEHALQDLTQILEKIRDNRYQPAKILRQDELVTIIRQRITIPGGTCNFDLPAYHHWLNQPSDDRHSQLRHWFSDLEIIERSIILVLDMVRNSAGATEAFAKDGFYQQAIEQNQSCQLVRILLPAEELCYPEVSGGRHRFTIRFMHQQSTDLRPVAIDQDVTFRLVCCTI